MPSFIKTPKDLIELIANDYDDFKRWSDHWMRENWLISSDYQDTIYSAIAIIYGKPVMMLYQEKKETVENPQITDVDVVEDLTDYSPLSDQVQTSEFAPSEPQPSA
jgi:hypothetical protein